MKAGIRFKLGLGFSLAFGIVASCCLAFTYANFTKSVREQMTDSSQIYLQSAFDYIRSNSDSGSRHRFISAIASKKGVDWVLVLDLESKEVIGASKYEWNGKLLGELPAEVNRVLAFWKLGKQLEHSDSQAFYQIENSLFIDTKDGEVMRKDLVALGSFNVHYALTEAQPFFAALIAIILISGGLYGALMIWFVTSLVVKRVELLKRLMEDDDRPLEPEMIPAEHNDEIDRLFSSFQSMRAKVESQNEEIRKLAQVAALTDNGVVISDQDERIIWVNDGFERITGYSREELIGRKPGKFLQGEKSDPNARKLMRESISNRVPFSAGIFNYTKEGEEYFVNIDAQPIIENDQFMGYIAVERDETERFLYEANLREAKEEADAANVAKSAFLAAMSHEIRTPMNGIIGIISLLENTRLDDEQKQMTSIIQRSGESLMTVINDILDYSKIESGELKISENDFVLDQVLDSPMALFANQCEKKGIAITANHKKILPYRVNGDGDRIHQILFNLIGNAIKFTKTGGVEVVFDYEKKAPSRILLKASVIDTGIGISENNQKKLFNRFYQVSDEKTRNIKGTGLGLAIVKNLSQLMGGSVSVESQEGKGSKFTFSVFLKVIDWEPPVDVYRRFKDSKFMVQIEDAFIAPRITDRLSNLGLEPCDDLSEADFFLCDRAPVMTREDLPVIMLQPFMGRVEIPNVIPFKAPFLNQDLVQILSSVLGRGDVEACSEEFLESQSLDSGDYSGLKVLVAEDSMINQKVIKMMLNKMNIEPMIVPNGKEAVTQFGQRFFDVILMDIHMPVMDGYQATMEIRALENGNATVIAALSAGVLAEQEHQAMSYGMDSFLSKPVKPDDILGLFAKHFRSNEGSNRQSESA